MTGVPWFYVLSGFLITTLLLREQRIAGRIALGRFYGRRLLRLYPVLLVCLLLIGLLSLLEVRPVSPRSWLAALVYVYNYIPRSLYDDWLGAFHTLATEEQFYLLFPLLMMLCRRRLVLLGAVLFLYIAAVPPTVLWLASTYEWTQDYFVFRWSVFAGYDIASGCLAALALDRFPSWFQHRRLWLACVGTVLFLSLMWTTLPAAVVMWSSTVGLACLILFVVLSPESIAVRMLEIRPLRYLGRVSYGVYVWQAFYVTTGPLKVGHWPLDFPWNLLLLVVTVPLSWHFLEKPFLRLKDRLRPLGPATV